MVLNDGSILVLGGESQASKVSRIYTNEMWRSSDGGKNWAVLTTDYAWGKFFEPINRRGKYFLIVSCSLTA